jgi:16S rRNA (guanine1207-N2)-methyltransferase
MRENGDDLDLLLAAIKPRDEARALFANAAPHPALAAWGPRVDCRQDWKPDADALAQADAKLVDAANGPYDTAFVRLQRQRQRHLGTLARALAALKPGGILAVCGPNAMGGARLADDLAEMGVEGKSTSKHKCRLVVAVRPATLDVARFVDLDAPRDVPAIGARSAPGVFAWDRIDPGTTLLLETLPPLTGQIADLGAGWGALARAILARNPGATLDAFEADAVAIACLRANLPSVNAHWHDVTKGLPQKGYAAAVSNLPFHDARGENRSLAAAFAAKAAEALKPGGVFYAVANAHLPYEKTLDTVFARVERLAERGGYKAFAAYTAATSGPSARIKAPGDNSSPSSRAGSTGPASRAPAIDARAKPKRA